MVISFTSCCNTISAMHLMVYLGTCNNGLHISKINVGEVHSYYMWLHGPIMIVCYIFSTHILLLTSSGCNVIVATDVPCNLLCGHSWIHHHCLHLLKLSKIKYCMLMNWESTVMLLIDISWSCGEKEVTTVHSWSNGMVFPRMLYIN